jgi:hypothetical protein
MKELEAVRRRADKVVPREARLSKPIAVATVVTVQQVARPAIEVRTSIEAATSSIEVVAPLVSMLLTLVFAPLMSLLLTYSYFCRLQIC